MKKSIPCGFVISLLMILPTAYAGKVELTTYYPAPYGEYKTLKSTDDSTFNSLTVGLGLGKIASNTALGFQALFKNTTGRNNTAVGKKALWANTTGNDNLAVGAEALSANTTGYVNMAVGYQALQENTIGFNN